jgi:hypothetical protein
MCKTSPEKLVEVVFKTKQEAQTWIEQWDWEKIEKRTKLLTVAHVGKQIRIWTELFSYFSEFEGGHFDTSDGKLFSINCDNQHVIAWLLDEIVDRMGGKFVYFAPTGSSFESIVGECRIVIPIR